MSLKKEKGINKLPNKVLLKVFQHFTEQQLCRVEQVCKRFKKIANHTWKLLYQKVFEYNQPLFYLEPYKFEFVLPDESAYENPWKESFRQLYRGVHVRSDFQNLTFNTQNLQYFDNIYDALNYMKKNKRDLFSPNLIFLHAGTYNLVYRGNISIYIEENMALIGAAPGDVANSVIIKGISNIMRVTKDVEYAYVGYLTLELTSSDLDKAHCLVIRGSLIIDHCIMRSSNYNSAAVLVSGRYANPVVKNCDISNCKYVGLHVNNDAAGIYENNTISCNAMTGIWVTNKAQPTVRQNNIYYNGGAGICVSNGIGCFDDNEVYDNETGFDISMSSENIIIRKNKISSKGNQDHTQLIGISFDLSCGTLEDNDICDHLDCGVIISNFSNPVVRNNRIKDNEIGVFVFDKGLGLLKQNYISKSKADNVVIGYSNPTLKQNHIFDGQGHGIYIYNKSAVKTLDANVIFENAQIGVLISSQSQATLKKNHILNNVAAGVKINSDATATLKYNIIRFNGSNGLRLAAGVRETLILKGNKIRDNNRS